MAFVINDLAWDRHKHVVINDLAWDRHKHVVINDLAWVLIYLFFYKFNNKYLYIHLSCISVSCGTVVVELKKWL
jgi:hypothetical protein